eukprot:g4355.t1
MERARTRCVGLAMRLKRMSARLCGMADAQEAPPSEQEEVSRSAQVNGAEEAPQSGQEGDASPHAHEEAKETDVEVVVADAETESDISDHSSDEYFTDTDSQPSDSESDSVESEDEEPAAGSGGALTFGEAEAVQEVEGGRSHRGRRKNRNKQKGKKKGKKSNFKNEKKNKSRNRRRRHTRRRRPKEQAEQRKSQRRERRRRERKKSDHHKATASPVNGTNSATPNAWGNSSTAQRKRRDARRARDIRLSQAKLENDQAVENLQSLLATPGAASDGRAWIVLAAVFVERSAHLHFLRQSNNETGPPRGWKTKFLGELQHQLDIVLTGSSDNTIRAQLADNLFQPLGWDLQRKAPIAGRPAPNYASIDAFLSKSIRFCRARESARRASRLKNVAPTATELQDIAEACDALWDLDEEYRFVPGRDYHIDLQRTTGGGRDAAPDNLFSWIDEAKLKNTRVFATFLALLDNYEFEPGKAERENTNEKREISDFLDACLETPCLNYVYKWLCSNRQFSGDYKTAFKRKLQTLWFEGYSRQSRNRRSDDSSAFEHVFVGEHKRDRRTGAVSVIGMHNWLAFYTFEQDRSWNYFGFKRPRGRRGRNSRDFESEQVLTLVFEWHGELKPVSTCFMGTSPSFEVALYTLAFLCDGGGEKTIPAELGPYRVGIQCYTYKGNKIGSCHPTDAPASPDEAATLIQSRVRGRQERRRGRRR